MLFSERYRDKIEYGEGEPVDHICEDVSQEVKCELSGVMHDFAEPAVIYPNRYDSYDVRTTALEIAVRAFNEKVGAPLVRLEHNVFDEPGFDPLAATFTPFLFDIIELQYNELSDGEKPEFQKEIAAVFQDNDSPWLLHDGRMIKIDSSQFEMDLRNKALSLMQELKDAEPKFQSAFTELTSAEEAFNKGDFQSAVNNAGKSYESVLKVIQNVDGGNADRLTTQYMSQLLSVPDTMSKSGFREKVMMSLPFVRNNSGADHGAGARTAVISKPMAKLAINLAAALDTYLIEEYIEIISTQGGR